MQQNIEIPGIESFHRESPRNIVFMFSGDINELIGRLSGSEIENLSIEEYPYPEPCCRDNRIRISYSIPV